MAKPPESFVGRERAAYTVVENKIFIFGGLDAAGKALNDAAMYDPLTDSWSLIPKATNTPSARQLASAVWTGKTVYIIGGTDANETTAFASGAKYDPTNMAWTVLPNMSVGRVAPYVANFTTSGYVLVWGGLNLSGVPISGGGYCAYFCQSWSAISTGTFSGGPPPLTDPTWIVAEDTSVLFFGGRTSMPQASNDAFQFVPDTSQWNTVAGPGPTARWGAFGVNDNKASYVWGGRNDTAAVSNGSRYVSNSGWSTLGETNVPSPRWAPLRRSGWMLALETGDVIVLGGMSFKGTLLTDGGRYTPSKSEWSSIEPWPSAEEHDYGVAVSIRGEVFVWGGRSSHGPTTTGERYLP
jgi:N-acetylneuraminic acid mutarotase